MGMDGGRVGNLVPMCDNRLVAICPIVVICYPSVFAVFRGSG